MEFLDADKTPLFSNKYGRMKADIVQFVSMREYINNPQQLAIETLKELPRQVSEYMRSINANPKSLINSPFSKNFNFQEMIKAEFIKVYGTDPNLQKAISIGIPYIESQFISIYTQPQYMNPLIK